MCAARNIGEYCPKEIYSGPKEPGSKWDQFNELPRALRDALNNAPFNFSTSQVYYQYYVLQASAAAIIASMERTAAAKIKRDHTLIWRHEAPAFSASLDIRDL